jgi:hypothetical protein
LLKRKSKKISLIIGILGFGFGIDQRLEQKEIARKGGRNPINKEKAADLKVR